MYSYREINKWNLLKKIRPILHPQGPYRLYPAPRKISIPEDLVELDTNQPWMHIKELGDRYCQIYTEVLVNCLNVIPERCLRCWKVVFRPQHLKDMFNLIPVMQSLSDKYGYSCKLGAEWRPWTSGKYGKWGLWGAYFYNNTDKMAIECWENVRDTIAKNENLKHLLNDIDEDGYPERLIVKRGCTEFEVAKFGDSINWKQTEEHKMWEKLVWERFEKQEFATSQTDEVKHNIKDMWYLHAHHAGDPTVIELNGGPLYPTTRFYHKELYESVKKKRAVEKSLRK